MQRWNVPIESRTESLDAYDCYLRGMAHVWKWTEPAIETALAFFYRAIDLDENFALAYACAARVYTLRKQSNWMADIAQESVEAVRLARRAIELGRVDESPASATTTRSASARQSRAATSSPASARAAASAASQISARLAAPTSAAPAALRTRSRATERSCWRTSPAMRTTTSAEEDHGADDDHEPVVAPRCDLPRAPRPARSASRGQQRERKRVSRGSRSGAASSSPRIDGCRAAAPHSR